MKKRIIAVLLTILLVFCILPATSYAAGSLTNFAKVNTYTSGQFTDVSSQWFATYVQAAYEYGLMTGTGGKTFSPGNNLTIAEAIKMAACLHSIYNTGSASFTGGSPWYQPYVDYALSNGIITAPYANYAANATRSDFAVIFAAAMPDDALAVMNNIDDNAIPDVQLGFSYGPAVYKLYRAGILTGSDATGTFKPTSSIQRSEVAAIVVRMANVSYRQSLALTTGGQSTSAIAAKCAPAVFYIEIYDSYGEAMGSGSGFFIDSSGIAVTCFHVISLASSAKITLKNGSQYDVAGFLGYDEQKDLALIQVDGSGFPSLTIGNSKAMATGSSVYAIGYPQGIDQTISAGLITNASHVIDGISNFMIDAAISPGSSGGALVNSSGQVVGVTCASYVNGQNLNLALPIDLISGITRGKQQPLSVLNTCEVAKLEYYADYFPAPTFTSVASAPLVDTAYGTNHTYDYNYKLFEYDADSMSLAIDDALALYMTLLRGNGFMYSYSETVTNGIRSMTYRYYYNAYYDVFVGISKTTYGGNSYIFIELYKFV
jgi:hypothetical protein